MKTVAFVTQKGGTGKSTLAVHIAVCAHRQGKTVAVIDLDPQGSALSWAKHRNTDDVPVISAKLQELPRLLAAAKHQGADLILIDTPGRADVIAAQVIEAADVVLIPCRASIYDLEASQHTAQEVRTASKRAAFVLNAVPPRGSRAQEAREALQNVLPVSPVELHNLVGYSDALNDGRSVEELDPTGKAAQEIRALYDWLIKL
jgi:chromosome partitioning protein